MQENLHGERVTNKHSLLQKQLLLSFHFESQDYRNRPRISRSLSLYNIIKYGIDRKQKL